MERYNIYYRKYSILANAFIRYVRVVYTNDIYHEVGKLICTSLEKISDISYTKPRVSVEQCEKYWIIDGYRKLSESLWIYDNDSVREEENKE